MSKLIDIAAERAVLSGLVKYGSSLQIEIADIIDTECFSKDFNKIVYKCCEGVLKDSSKIDIPSLLSVSFQLGFAKLFEVAANLAFIKSLYDYPVLPENVLVLSKKLRKLQIARRCQNTLKEAYDKIGEITGEESINDIMDKFEQPITELSVSLNTGMDNNPIQLMADSEEYAQHLADNPVHAISLSTGWPLLDSALGYPLRRKSVSIWVSRTGEGKTHIAKSVCLHNALKGIPVLFLDSEMDKSSQVHRTLAQLSRVDIRSIETGQFGADADRRRKVIDSARKVKNIPFYYLDAVGQDFDSILRICRRWIHNVVGKDDDGNLKDCLIVYDYFKLSDSSQRGGFAEHEAFGYQINQAHQFCKKYDLPLLTFAQTNRTGITDETLATVANSDKLAQNATTVCMFKPKTPDEIQEDGHQNGNMKFIPLKTRHGSSLSAGDFVMFEREGQYSTFREIGLKSQMDTSKAFEEEGVDGEPTEF